MTKHIFVSRLWMVMSQSVQGVACNKELQRANKSGTFVNSSNGTYFSPRSLSDRLSRRNDGLIPAWTSQVMVYVNVSELVITFIVRYAGQGKGDGNDAVGESQDDDVKQCQLSSECIVVGRNLHVGLRRDMARPLPR